MKAALQSIATCYNKNMLIDTHCHLHDRSCYNYALSHQQIGKKLLKKYPDYPHLPADFTPEKMLSRAHAAGVEKMICIGTSHDDSLVARDFAEKYHDQGVFWAYGIHPDEAESLNEPETVLPSSGGIFFATGKKDSETPVTTGCRAVPARGWSPSLASTSPIAIGEVGLDYHSGESNRKKQIALFERMIQLAKDNDLPLIFHIRDAFDDFFAIIKNFSNLHGVVHSFSDNSLNLKKSLEHDFYIGVNGLATFAPELPTREIPLAKMLLETDAPFLTPSPFRGTVNEAAHIKDICAYISNISGESEAKIAEITTKNAEQLFKI